jgi:hypothetical protein
VGVRRGEEKVGSGNAGQPGGLPAGVIQDLAGDHGVVDDRDADRAGAVAKGDATRVKAVMDPLGRADLHDGPVQQHVPRRGDVHDGGARPEGTAPGRVRKGVAEERNERHGDQS